MHNLNVWPTFTSSNQLQPLANPTRQSLTLVERLSRHGLNFGGKLAADSSLLF
jgi:hypothetical protein